MQAIKLAVVVLSVVTHVFVWPTPPGIAQTRTPLRQQVNTGTIGLVSGGVNGTYIQVAADLATVLDGVENLRILPIIGKGSAQNITDLLYLKGVDISIVQSDVLSYLSRQRVYGGLPKRVHYITKLYNEELHLLAGEAIQSLQDLAGKKVNVGIDGSGTQITASTIFDRLEIEVESTSFDQSLALEKLKQGEIAGMIYVAGKPTRLFQHLEPESGIHFVPVPGSASLLDTYLPAVLTAEDYPGLIPPDSNVSTVAVSAVLAVFNWNPNSSRYQNVARFVDAFFSRFDQFQQPPRHQKWTEVSLTALVPGWTRFKAAETWLKQNRKTPEEEIKALFMKFLSDMTPASGTAPLTAEQRNLLFQEFIRWQSQQQ
ncbi:MAG: TAXI family TRAP transporter solute-binding subunit [Candidatus Tectomicrobia bacterium]|nr:TAXI family TRAP transporter solute-binding subunit [Candidatus Tectomicrobia bacterium]